MVLTALWHPFRGGREFERTAQLAFLDPFDGIANYMSWHFTERLSALGFRQYVLVDLQTGLLVPGRRQVLIIFLSVLLFSPALVS